MDLDLRELLEILDLEIHELLAIAVLILGAVTGFVIGLVKGRRKRG
jgi:hypothetical protein